MSDNGPDEYERLTEHTERARQGNLAKEAEKLASRGHPTGRPISRAITSRWISDVPSPISRILASR